MRNVIDGIRRFYETTFPARQSLFESLAETQSPTVLWITCCDSRVDPCLITQTEPGELFVLRTIGNIVPNYEAPGRGEAAAVEYAVRALGVQDIVVCGHSNCGAMKGVLAPDAVQTMPAVKQWLDYAAPVRKAAEEHPPFDDGSTRLEWAVQQNAVQQLDNLKSHPCVAEALESGKLQLHAWYYRIPTGEILAYDESTGGFSPVE